MLFFTKQALPPGWSSFIPLLNSLGNASIMFCGYLIPDGRFVPRWTRWLAIVMLGYWAALALFPSWELGQSVLSLVLFCGFIVGTMVVQVYRYRYVSTPRQRQQTKWLVFGTLLAVGGNIGARLLYYFVLLPLFRGSPLAGALEITFIMAALLVPRPIWWRTLALMLNSESWCSPPAPYVDTGLKWSGERDLKSYSRRGGPC